VRANGGVRGYPGGEEISREEFWKVKTDFLIPAALEHEITMKNVDDVDARVIIEGANHPISPAAEQRLRERKTTIIPDILANAGGVVVSYFEWVQNKNSQIWRLSKIQDELEFILKSNFREILDGAAERKVDLRTAGYILALERLAAIYELRGIFP
jgi:glutamate dehydrogenase (NAD(P)+)